MWIYIIVFSTTILCLSVWYTLPVLLVRCGVLMIIGAIGRFSYKAWMTMCVAVVSALLACARYIYRTQAFISTTSTSSYIQGEYVILERQTADRRQIGSTTQEQQYLLYSSEQLQQGQKIRLSSDVQNARSLPLWPQWTPIDREGIQSVCFLLDRYEWLPLCVQDWSYDFRFDRRMLMKGVQGVVYEPSLIVRGEPDRQGIQYLLRTYLDRRDIAEHNQALIMGMLVGDRSLMSSEMYDMFVESGLVHLIAVSGGNIVLLILCLSWLLTPLPFYLRQVVLLVVLCRYVRICGMDSSVVRAGVMGGLSLIALMVGREVSVVRLLIYARCIMLWYNPFFLVYDLGFTLSFSAVVGLVWSQRYALPSHAKLLYSSYSKYQKEKTISTKVDNVDKLWTLIQSRQEQSGNNVNAGAMIEDEKIDQKSFYDNNKPYVDKVDKKWTLLYRWSIFCGFPQLHRRACGRKAYRYFYTKTAYVYNNYVLPCRGATRGVLPVLLFFIGYNNLTSILINMIVAPLVPLVMLGSLCVLLVILVLDMGGGLVEIFSSVLVRVRDPIVRASERIYARGFRSAEHALHLSVSSPAIALIRGITIVFYAWWRRWV